jgi:hypothetical protein
LAIINIQARIVDKEIEMKITVGTTPEIDLLYIDERDLEDLLDKLRHRLHVDPRDYETKAEILVTRSELVKVQGRISKLTQEARK